ncbi:MAG TPA: hypothetical protein VFD92_03130 [Candidatus Binatia bacterium]|nr:hypothetical protein [Candidatus Binatia bacterium]
MVTVKLGESESDLEKVHSGVQNFAAHRFYLRRGSTPRAATSRSGICWRARRSVAERLVAAWYTGVPAFRRVAPPGRAPGAVLASG